MNRAIDELRTIARSSTDPYFGSLVERWIQEHVIECSNQMHLSRETQKAIPNKEIEHHNRATIRRMAEIVIDRGATIETREADFGGTLTTRRICVVLET